VADVPLQGPGTWIVATNAAASVTLTCAGTTIAVNQQFVIAAHTACQVTIMAQAPNHLVTWELTPAN
jgi:isoaspartyl peptidase/L-asparaginase-like protein (Ntn-hydrolase superfamily)